MKIKQIDIEFKKGTGEADTARSTNSVPAETTFAGKTTEDIKPEIKVYNWREEFDDPEDIEK